MELKKKRKPFTFRIIPELYDLVFNTDELPSDRVEYIFKKFLEQERKVLSIFYNDEIESLERKKVNE